MVHNLSHRNVAATVLCQTETVHQDFGVGVDGEDACRRDVDGAVAQGVSQAIAKSRIKRTLLAAEEAADVAQAGHFKDLRLSEVDFAAKSSDGSVGA